jgi:hypothetical protein
MTPEERFDDLAAQIHDWTESVVALDAGHFPAEMVSELEDLLQAVREFLEEEGSDAFGRRDFAELLTTPEMSEVLQRFPKLRRVLDRNWGGSLSERIMEEEFGYVSESEDEDEEE